jgi:hypothetical protein
MMKRLFLCFILMLLSAAGVVGCAAENAQPVPTLTETISPTNTLIPSETATLPPPTATYTPTPTPYLRECIKLEKVEQIEAEGVLIIEKVDDYVPVLTHPDGTQIKIISNIYYLSGVISSPDRTKIAYIQEFPRVLVIASADGSILRRYQIPENWVWPINWVSENQIYFEKRLYLGESKFESGKLIVFDLETSHFEEFQPDFPDIVPWVEAYPNWGVNMTFLPDPTLRYSVYAVAGGGIVLWDLQSQIEVKRVYDKYTATSAPVWSKDGEWFIANAPNHVFEDNVRYTNWESDDPYSIGYDLFLGTTTGEIQRLSYFTPQYHATQRSWSLSPDEINLAFWLDTGFGDGDYDWQLAVLNITSGDVNTYCVFAGDARWPFPPIWSPDGDGLMVTQYDEIAYFETEVLIIDLIDNELFTYPENAFGRGVWLTLGE